MPTVDRDGNGFDAPLGGRDEVCVPGGVALAAAVSEVVPRRAPVLQDVHATVGVRQFLADIEQYAVHRQDEAGVVVAASVTELRVSERLPVASDGVRVIGAGREFELGDGRIGNDLQGPPLVVDEPVEDALTNPLLGSRTNRLVADQALNGRFGSVGDHRIEVG